MNPPVSSPTTSDSQAPSAEKQFSVTEIDSSCRSTLLFLFTSGMVWLVIGVLFSLISAIKLHAPGFLGSPGWLTLGRIRPAAMNAILYGFATQTALGVLLWMMCRLGRNRLHFQTTLAIAITFWNMGVTIGIWGILVGGGTGFAWLEMPRYASPILFGAYALIGVCGLITFHSRRERSLYVSQWYLLVALFWFPWIYSAANLLLVFFPVRGVVQSIVNAWFTGNFLGLWLGPVGLAVIYYFIPKLTGRPLYSQSMAAFGFWTLVFFGSWTGPVQLVGGPIPAWIISAGIAANVLLIVPLICVAMNWHLTFQGLYPQVKQDATLRFILFSAASYLIASLLGIILSLREVSAVTHLTYAEAGQVQLALLGFVCMALFGGINYIVPRLVQQEWPCARKVRVHFWFSAAGIALIVIALVLGGLVQGFGINNPSKPFIDVVRSTVPFIGLSTLGQFVFLGGQIAMLLNLIEVVRRQAEPFRQSVSTLIVPGEPYKEGVRS